MTLNIYALDMQPRWTELKRDLHQLKQFCVENGLATVRAKSVETCLMAIYLEPNCIQNCQDQGFRQAMK